MSGASRHYVLAAGGTGGHLLPAFALAAELDRRGHRVALITDVRGATIPGKPDVLPAHIIAASPIGKNPLKWPAAIKAILEGRAMARRLFDSFEPSAVVGFGGYPVFPALLAANAARLPTLVHEQNAVLGRVNRFFAGTVNAIATAYPEIARLKQKYAGKVHLVGNPVRADLLQLRDEPFPSYTADSPLRVLVTGGSQGARILSQVVPEGLAALPPDLRARLDVTQQCRAEDLDAVRALYDSHGIQAELGTYFEDMAARLADAHLFIGRAGASTIAELTAVGRPAILIPLPIATDDHQTANAREMAKSGGARVIDQSEFTPATLASRVEELTHSPSSLAAAAHAAWNCGRPDAVRDLADLVESFGGGELMDVIRLGSGETRAATQRQTASQGAAREQKR